jgi:hypothetical protein
VRNLTEGRGVDKAKWDLAVRLGLKPYAEFETIICPLLKRLEADRQTEISGKIYALTVEKKIREADKKDFQAQEQTFRVQQKSISNTRKHINKATEELLAAQAAIHPDLPRCFDVEPFVSKLRSLNKLLEEQEALFSRLTSALQDPTGKTITHLGTTTMLTLDPAFAGEDGYVFPGMKSTATDYPFIRSLGDLLPSAHPGKRSRFDRAEIIGKVLEILGESCSKSRITYVLNLPKEA